MSVNLDPMIHVNTRFGPVWYTKRRMLAEQDKSLIEFTYEWTHTPTNKTGSTTVWCHKQEDMFKLINEWNSRSTSWKYVLLSRYI